MNIKLRHSIWGRLCVLTFGRLLRTYVDAEIASASVEYSDPTKVLINFMWNLDATSVPDVSAFILAGKTITNVEVAGAQITLTVSVAYVYGDSITVEYTVPILNGLIQESSGSWVNNFTQAVSNYANTPNVATYISGLTTPLGQDQLDNLNAFTDGLLDDLGDSNLTEAFDFMYDLGGETAESSLKNLVKNTHHAIAVNSPAFVQYEGWTGGTGKWIDTNYNPATQGSRYTLNNCSLGVYSRTDATGLYSDIGSRTSTSDYTAILSRYSGNAIMRLHNAVNPSVTDPEANSLGMFIACRNAASQTGLFGYHNKSSLTVTDTGNTTNIPNCNIFIGARNNNGTPEQESIRQLSFAFAGRYFNSTEVGYITDRNEALRDARGKGVIV